MQIQPRLFEEDAKSVFGKFEVRCRRCVERAEVIWNNACNAEPRLRKAARGRGRNSIFNEIVADCARDEFGNDAEVDICECYGTVRLHFGQQYDLGFKKVDHRGRHSNYPTSRQQGYDKQMRLFEGPLPEAIRLHIGIVWNRAGTEVIDVQLIYPHLRTKLWGYSLRSDDGQGVAAIQLPKPQSPPPAAKFRSKKAKEGEQTKRAS